MKGRAISDETKKIVVANPVRARDEPSSSRRKAGTVPMAMPVARNWPNTATSSWAVGESAAVEMGRPYLNSFVAGKPGPASYPRRYRFNRPDRYVRAVTSAPAPKPCVSCGRVITWRKKWEQNWDEVKYCSDACRSRKVSALDDQLSSAIMLLLGKRQNGATICPSEAAQLISPDDWRDLMEPARRAARRLMNDGRVEITQRGKPIDPSTARGPIRIRLS
jgi:hypothetical protein